MPLATSKNFLLLRYLKSHICNRVAELRFIKESLLQIVDGITEANTALEAKGASIPTTGVAGEGVWWTLVKEGKTSTQDTL